MKGHMWEHFVNKKILDVLWFLALLLLADIFLTVPGNMLMFCNLVYLAMAFYVRKVSTFSNSMHL